MPLVRGTRYSTLARVSAVRSWNPQALASLGAWFDPSWGTFSDAGITPASVDGGVYRWVARYPLDGSIYWQQATGANQPILRQGANGKYYLEGDGTNDEMTMVGDTAFTAVQSDATLWATCKRIKNATYQALISGDDVAGGAGFGLQFDSSNNSYTAYGNSYRNGNSTTGSWFRLLGTAKWNGSANVLATYHNNVDVSGSGSNNTGNSGGTHFRLFRRPDATPQYCGAYIGHCGFNTVQMSSSDRSLLDDFLSSEMPS